MRTVQTGYQDVANQSMEQLREEITVDVELETLEIQTGGSQCP